MSPNEHHETPYFLVRKLISHYKQFLYVAMTIMLMVGIFFSGFLLFLVVKHHETIFYMLKNGYTYQTSAEVMIKVDTPVKVDSPVKKTLQIPINQLIHVTVPVKTSVTIPVKQNFYVDLKKPIAIKIDHEFPVHDIVSINFTAPVDTDIMATAFGVSKNVHIKGGIPISFDVPISQNFRVNDTFMLKINDPIAIPVSHVFQIPVETKIDVDVPVNLLMDVPLNTKIQTDIMIQGEVPVLIDFEINFDLLKGITIKGIRMNPNKEEQ